MGLKEDVSTWYLEGKIIEHSQKQRNELEFSRALVLGAEKPGSIGMVIGNRLEEAGATVLVPPKATLDVRYSADVHRYFEGLQYTYKLPDILVLSHGETWLDWIEDQPTEAIEDIVQTNLLGTIFMVREFVRRTMTMGCRKTIILIGSMAYNHVLNGSAPYCASKAGLAMFMKCAAHELGPKGYDICAIHPSNVEGAPMSEATILGLMRYRGLTRAQAEEYWSAGLTRDRFLTPEEVADVAMQFITGTGYLSGCNIELGGGNR